MVYTAGVRTIMGNTYGKIGVLKDLKLQDLRSPSLAYVFPMMVLQRCKPYFFLKDLKLQDLRTSTWTQPGWFPICRCSTAPSTFTLVDCGCGSFATNVVEAAGNDIVTYHMHVYVSISFPAPSMYIWQLISHVIMGFTIYMCVTCWGSKHSAVKKKGRLCDQWLALAFNSWGCSPSKVDVLMSRYCSSTAVTLLLQIAGPCLMWHPQSRPKASSSTVRGHVALVRCIYRPLPASSAIPMTLDIGRSPNGHGVRIRRNCLSFPYAHICICARTCTHAHV